MAQFVDLGIEGLIVRDSLESLGYVIEQDTAYNWSNPGRDMVWK